MKIFQSLLLLIFCFTVSAQTGEIIYSKYDASRVQGIESNVNMPEDMKKQFAGMMASMSQSTQKLVFNDSASNYVDFTDEQSQEINKTNHNVREVQIVMRREANLEEYYVDFSKKSYIHKRNIFGKYFIVKEDVDHPKWKLITEQKEVLGYACMKATAENSDGEVITAWYTMSIPLPLGPDVWGGLPGAIMELKESKGGTSYTATSVNLAVDPSIEVPKDGKKISLKKFLKLEERKIKEREELSGGNIQVIGHAIEID